MPNHMPVHAFGDDALGDSDATEVAARIRRGEISTSEVAQAAVTRARKIDPQLEAIAFEGFEQGLEQARAPRRGVFSGVPTFIKDNVDVAGLPTGHGSAAVQRVRAPADSAFTTQFSDQGFVVLGKSRLPEFGLNASTEFKTGDPARNPWNPAYSCGASSGGAAVLVASGVVPIAHANDGGGSIRIPAACCGLIGLKPSRGRLIESEAASTLPVRIISEGVVTRSVRDTANFFAGMEQTWRNPKLPPVGLVEAPGKKRLRIGLVYDSITQQPTDAETRAAVQATAKLLESMGHRVEEMALPIAPTFPGDFTLYWGMLAWLLSSFGHRLIGPGFDATKLDNLTQGLAGHYRKHFVRTPLTLFRLRQVRFQYARMFRDYDVLLSPVLSHTTPELGDLSPRQPFEPLMEKLLRYVAFTPLNNVAGSPGLTLPMGATRGGLPIGVHFSAATGAERTLLELAYEIEEAHPWRRIQDVGVTATVAAGTQPAGAVTTCASTH